MSDVIDLLPSDTKIHGMVGNSSTWVRFNTTAGALRADVVAACEKHALAYADYFREGTASSSTTPASYWLYDTAYAEVDEFPGLGDTALDNPIVNERVAAIDSAYAPRVGDTLVHPDGEFHLERRLTNNGFIERFLISEA